MKKMKAREIRRSFLEYFESKGHTVVPSFSLIPGNDPTLLFTNAGMVQFKDVFLGREKLHFSRAASAQKCLRVSGKHNDLEEVGKTARHNTFFEMLGNFSFGDYFKAEAITFGWEFLAGVMGLPRDRLWATVYRDDDEAFGLWQELTGVPAGRIVRLGEKDNFWAMGDTGPCGPCSEIIFDRGEEHRCDRPECGIGKCDCDRWLELWNLVFMQFNRDASGVLTPLPRPSIDTGMGLERITSVMQGAANVFRSDLLWPIIEATETLSGRDYRDGPEGMPFRVIADHSRACSFLIADGVFPANEGRGYVLRRILRRAVRFGKVLGLERPFLYQLVPVVREIMGETYAQLGENMDYIQKVIKVEEERFGQTLDQGMTILEGIIEDLKGRGDRVLRGREAFVLYDTYGFPLDLTEDVAREADLAVDRQGFEAAMAEQRHRARAARGENLEQRAGGALDQELAHLPATTFIGYSTLEAEAEVLAVLREGVPLEEAVEGEECSVVLDRTPFYAEAGGQVGDLGTLRAEGVPSCVAQVMDTVPASAGKTLHRVRVDAGVLRPGMRVQAWVDGPRRMEIRRNHTATHLLHRALKDVLGEHVNQAGSLVAPERLRFDFSHYQAVTGDELVAVENAINDQVLQDLSVETFETSLAEAQAAGAMALFGEKYSDRVRVVKIGQYSLELCGGTHAARTGQLGMVKLVSESSIGSGIRRIEAVTGLGLLRYLRQLEDIADRTAALVKGGRRETPDRVRELQTRVRDLERHTQELEGRLAGSLAQGLLNEIQEIGGVKVLAVRAPATGMEALRTMVDAVRDRLPSGVIILGAHADDKALFVTAVTADLVKRGLHAGRIISRVAAVAGGGGGGRPDLAQAGGKNPARLGEALAAGLEAVGELLAGGSHADLTAARAEVD